MFGSRADSGFSNAAASGGSELIPTRFIWPYGGRSVSLCGSFNGWSELIKMTPVEGYPTYFEATWALSPGQHQFKFFVDGDWRLDKDLPSVNGKYGMVNIVSLPQNPNLISASYNPETPRSNMDVDHDPFLCTVSEADIELSRHRVSAFLSTQTAYELIPESGKVHALDIGLPVKQAFHILHEQGLSMAILWDSTKGNYVGILSASDFILILRELGTHGSNLTEEELETHTISAWKEGKLQLSMQAHGSSRSNPRHLVHVGPADSQKDLAIMILQNKVATVPILYSPSPDGSFPQILHMASLSEILKSICRHFRHCSSTLPVLEQPICSLPLGTWVPKPGESNGRPFAMLRPNASLGSALSFLIQADVSSVPIVDSNDSLLDIYCRSDIFALAKDRAYAKIHLDEMNIQEALQLGQDANHPYGFLNGQRCQMCLRTDSLHKVMERLSIPGVRRLVIVEAGSKRVEGIVSLSDVFRFLLG